MRTRVPGFFSIAPMIDKTDRYFRYFARLLTKKAILYTEMVTAAAIIHGDTNRLLDFDAVEKPLVLQIGGDDPEEIGRAVQIAEAWNYDEYNLNVGCPSDRVQKGNFGACLMATPERVRDILHAMRASTSKPVTVKHRVGIEGNGVSLSSYDDLANFVRVVAESSPERFVVHARIAVLEGLSPKENRTIPPIRYEDVYRLAADFPDQHFEINGQIRSITEAMFHFEKDLRGVMFGRASYENPWMLAGIDSADEAIRAQRGWTLESDNDLSVRKSIVRAYFDAADRWVATARSHGRILNPRTLVWPVLELFPTVRGSKKYKQVLSASIPRDTALADLAGKAISFLEK